MPEITKIEIQQKNKNRANLYLDDEFFCGISIELCLKYSLKKGIQVNSEFINEIVLEDEKSKAMNKAVNYISSTLKTTKQIRNYLKKKDYSPQTIDHVISKMEEYKYVDDESYARAFINTYSNKYGKIKLISALKSKGVSEHVIDNVFDENLNLESNIEKVAEKYLKNKEVNKDTLNKLSRFLCSRGYEFDEINSYINNLKNK